MFVIAWYVNGDLDAQEPFLTSDRPTWGELVDALRFETRESAREKAAWWDGSTQGNAIVIEEDA